MFKLRQCVDFLHVLDKEWIFRFHQLLLVLIQGERGLGHVEVDIRNSVLAIESRITFFQEVFEIWTEVLQSWKSLVLSEIVLRIDVRT